MIFTTTPSLLTSPKAYLVIPRLVSTAGLRQRSLFRLYRLLSNGGGTPVSVDVAHAVPLSSFTTSFLYGSFSLFNVFNFPNSLLTFFYATIAQSTEGEESASPICNAVSLEYLVSNFFIVNSLYWWVWHSFMLPSLPFMRKFTLFYNCVALRSPRRASLGKVLKLDGILRIGVKRRFVGITLSIPRNVDRREYRLLTNTGSVLAQVPTDQHKTILTLSNTLVLKLYALQSTVKLTQPLLLLMIRLLRRYLVTLNLKRLSIHVGNFGESLPFLWRTLITPLNEVFNHPRALRLIGDLGVDAGVSRSSPTASLALSGRVFSFLEHYRNKTAAFFAHAAESNLGGASLGSISSIFTTNFLTLWNAFCRTFLLNCKLTNHPFSDKRIFSNFCLTISFCQFTTNPRRAWVYRKKLRSLKRRLVKRVTKEATKRLWLF